MTGKTHAAVGCMMALIVSRPETFQSAITVAVIGTFAGILPDIDISTVDISRHVHAMTAALCILLVRKVFMLVNQASSSITHFK